MARRVTCRYTSLASHRAWSAGGALVLACTSASATVPREVYTLLTFGQVDALTIAGLVLVAIIAIFAFKFMRKGL